MVILGTPLGPGIICLELLDNVKFYGIDNKENLFTISKILRIMSYIFLGITILLGLFVIRFKVFYYSNKLQSKRARRAKERKALAAQNTPGIKKKTFLQMFQISPTLFGVANNRVSSSDSLPENSALDSKRDDQLCVVCFDNPHNTVIDPCGHGGVCSTCIKDLLKQKNSNCPLCRVKINLVIVYKKDEQGRYEQVDELVKDKLHLERIQMEQFN